MRLIETGGTICMVPGPDGLQPHSGRVTAALARLHPEVGIRGEAILPLIDSADAGPALWNALLDRIEAEPGPVIITHGTDTMAFTGAALDTALAGKAVCAVLTGSMAPLGSQGGDAEANLDLAVAAARHNRRGIRLAFAGRVLPAGRITKAHSHRATAFVRAGSTEPPPFPAARRFADRKLAILTLTPGLPAPAMAAALAELDGAVLRVFGAGTMPNDAALAQSLRQAVDRGCRLVAISQCHAGGLAPGAYAAGAPLWQAGVQDGGALSAEQALARLWLDLS